MVHLACSSARLAKPCFAIAVVIASLLVCDRAFAADPDERQMLAQSLYEQGVKLAETDSKGALKAFRQSYETQPDFHVLYNIGKVCTKLNDVPCATKAYEQYLKDGGSEISARKKKEVEAELKALAKAAGTTVTIKSSIKGADVQIDGVSVGKTPIDKPVIVKEGSHKIVLVQGNSPIEKTVKVANGTNETVELEPPKKEEPAAPAPAPAPPPPPPPAPEPVKHEAPPPPPPKPVESSGSSFPIVPWAVTGALAAGTVVTGILTAGARSDYNDKREVYPITRDELESAHGKATNLFVVTSILGGLTAVSAGVAAYFTIKAGKKENNVAFVVGPTGVAITGKLR